MTKDEVYNELVKYTKKFDNDFYQIITANEKRTKDILNIEREQKKPRKDIAYYSDVKKEMWYMFDELYTGDINYEFQSITDKTEISNILKLYIEKHPEHSKLIL